MFLSQTKEVFSDLMVNQALTDITPGLWWRSIVDEQEDYYQKSDAARCIDTIDEELYMVTELSAR